MRKFSMKCSPLVALALAKTRPVNQNVAVAQVEPFFTMKIIAMEEKEIVQQNKTINGVSTQENRPMRHFLFFLLDKSLRLIEVRRFRFIIFIFIWRSILIDKDEQTNQC